MSAVSRGLVFPTPVGMNRQTLRYTERMTRVPHARGDEPQVVGRDLVLCRVFPTPVGMNR